MMNFVLVARPCTDLEVFWDTLCVLVEAVHKSKVESWATVAALGGSFQKAIGCAPGISAEEKLQHYATLLDNMHDLNPHMVLDCTTSLIQDFQEREEREKVMPSLLVVAPLTKDEVDELQTTVLPLRKTVVVFVEDGERTADLYSLVPELLETNEALFAEVRSRLDETFCWEEVEKSWEVPESHTGMEVGEGVIRVSLKGTEQHQREEAARVLTLLRGA